MEASQEKIKEPQAEVSAEVSALTAKQMAAAEEINALRAKQLSDAQQEGPDHAAVPIADLAARGYDALHQAREAHRAKAARAAPYVPPPRTDRQMSVLEEELQAGARAVERNRAQQAASRPAPADPRKEGFTTPVYRPGDVVPDPIAKGMKGFSPDV